MIRCMMSEGSRVLERICDEDLCDIWDMRVKRKST